MTKNSDRSRTSQ